MWLLFSCCMRACRRSQKFWRILGYCPIKRGCGWPPRNTFLPRPCYHTKFCCSWSNHFDVGRGPKNFGGCWGPCRFGTGACVSPRNILLSHVCYRTKFGRMLKRLGIGRGTQNIWEMLGPCSLGIGAWLTHSNTLLAHVCYHTKFRHLRSNTLSIRRRSQNFRDAGIPPPWECGISDL